MKVSHTPSDVASFATLPEPPFLTGFLTQAGIKNVSQRDLGIELLDKILTQGFAHNLYRSWWRNNGP